MRTLIVVCLALLAHVLARPAYAEELQLGNFRLNWPVGYSVKAQGKGPVELAGPGGVKILVTVLRLKAGDRQPEPEKLRATLERVLAQQVERAGKLSLPPAREPLADGGDLQFAGADVGGWLKSGFFLSYLANSPQGDVALVSFEGAGDVRAEHEKALPILRQVRWVDSAAQEAAFTERVAGLLRHQLPGQEVQIVGALTLKLGESQANLDRVFVFCQRQAANCDAELESYVRGVSDAQGAKAAPAKREDVRLVIRNSAYVAAARASGAGDKVQMLTKPLVEGLFVLPVLDQPRTLQMVGRAALKELGMDEEEIYALGLANLQAHWTPLDRAAPPIARGKIGLVHGDVYDPSRLLTPAAWASLAKAQAGVLLVAIPANDTLFYIGDDDPQAITVLRSLARDTMREAAAPLSDLVLRWSPEGWQRVP